MRDDCAVFIITHGRPNNQKTLDLLNKFGFNGKVYLVLDDLDPTIPEYVKNFGEDKLIIFSKMDYVERTECGIVEPVIKFAVFARNAVEDIAESMGLKYFMVFDDDIVNFRIRYDEDGSLKSRPLKGICDDVFDAMLEFMDRTNLTCTGFGFCNSYRSGAKTLYKLSSRNRLCAEAFIRRTSVKVHWRLNMVEDLITSLDYNRVGYVWLQLLQVQVEIQMSEGKVDGGNSDAYNNYSAFRRVFMPTLVYPDCNLPRQYNDKWVTTLDSKVALPQIVSSKYKKPRA